VRALLLCLAAALLPAPAAAIDTDHPALVANNGVRIHSGIAHRRGHGGNFGRGDAGLLYYDREYQGDTAWRPDSFNDWWHDNPTRAYPRWMLSNQNCEREWYQGNVLRC